MYNLSDWLCWLSSICGSFGVVLILLILSFPFLKYLQVLALFLHWLFLHIQWLLSSSSMGVNWYTGEAFLILLTLLGLKGSKASSCSLVVQGVSILTCFTPCQCSNCVSFSWWVGLLVILAMTSGKLSYLFLISIS